MKKNNHTQVYEVFEVTEPRNLGKRIKLQWLCQSVACQQIYINKYFRLSAVEITLKLNLNNGPSSLFAFHFEISEDKFFLCADFSSSLFYQSGKLQNPINIKGFQNVYDAKTIPTM